MLSILTQFLHIGRCLIKGWLNSWRDKILPEDLFQRHVESCGGGGGGDDDRLGLSCPRRGEWWVLDVGASEGLNAASWLFSAQKDGRSHSVGFALCTSDGIRASGGQGEHAPGHHVLDTWKNKYLFALRFE